MDSWLLENLACPRHGIRLHFAAASLECPSGCRYPIVNGIPVLLRDDVEQTMDIVARSVREGRDASGGNELFLDTISLSNEEREGIRRLARDGSAAVDPAVSYLVAATNGIAYKPLIGRLTEYPIPALRLPDGNGQVFLDIGCSWGRWSIAAARKGYLPVGIDPSLGAVMAAQRVARQLGLRAVFVVGDARYLPFRDASFDVVFSYSVIQHFSREDAAKVVQGTGRVLKPGGSSLIQMPTKYGLRCLSHQARRRFREGRGFEVRYWSLPSLRRLFTSHIGQTEMSVDCYFGIGLQYSDIHLMTPPLKVVVLASELLRRASRFLRPLIWGADSVYVASTKATREGVGRSENTP